MTETMDKATRLIRAATGEEYGDGYTVTDVATEYAEPGYRSDSGVIVFGNWNPPRYPKDGDEPLTKAERLAPRLADALEGIGADVEWLDEWAMCEECHRAVRTEGDSYSWRPSYAWQNECEIVCTDCLLADMDTSLEPYVNEPTKAVTWCDAAQLVDAGWELWEPPPKTVGDLIRQGQGAARGGRYQSGWHEGMDDKPDEVFAKIRDVLPEVDVVFLLDENSQFYISFSAWTRDDPYA